MNDSVLKNFVVKTPPPIKPLLLEAEDAPLVEGEIVVYPSPRGRAIGLRFAGPFEAFLTLEGKRVTEAKSTDSARLLTWIGRRLPPLYRALEQGFGLDAILTLRGVEVIDVVDLQTGARPDHAGARRRLAESNVIYPPLAILGPISGQGELQARLRGMFASGTLLEVRREESGWTLGRRHIRVGR